MRKRILSIFMAVIVCSSLGIAANAQEIYEPNNSEVIEGTMNTSPRADIIECKYRTHNGINQFRRWNSTRGYWVDPYWIDIK